jgi:hypothetical protein
MACPSGIPGKHRLKYARPVRRIFPPTAQKTTNCKIPRENPLKTVDARDAVRIMPRSFAGTAAAEGVKKALFPVDRVDAACIMVGLPGDYPGPLFNNMIK